VDWFPAVMTLVGVVIGVGIQELRIWRERKDKYKDMIFEKRLDAHQGGYYWCMKLLSVMMPNRLMKDGGLSDVDEKLGGAMEWLDKNALYLNQDSRVKMNEYFQYVSETSLKYKDVKGISNINIGEETEKLVENAGKVLSSIQKGIGVEYIPEKKLSREKIEIEKELGGVAKKIEELVKRKRCSD
jgi:hypothetical protein